MAKLDSLTGMKIIEDGALTTFEIFDKGKPGPLEANILDNVAVTLQII